ncbi:MAG: hypothetical protein V1819_03680 [bacterium]
MTKQSIKEFLVPQSKFLILGFVSSVAIFMIVATAGIESLNEFLGNFLFLAFIFGKIAEISRIWVSIFSFIVWVTLLSYFFSCLFASIYQKKFGKASVEVGAGKSFRKKLIKNILGVFFLVFIASIFLTAGTWDSGGGAKNSRIISAIAQSRTFMTYTFANDGNYVNFNCNFEDMRPLCEEIDRNFGSGDYIERKDGKEPVIVLSGAPNPSAACIYSLLNPSKSSGWVDWLKRRFSGTLKEWYCADSSGRAGRTNIDPGGAGYCVDGVSAKCPPIFQY